LLLGVPALLHAVLRGVTPEQAAGLTWAQRARVEREAAAFFARLGARMRGVGAPGALIELAERASLDEERHAAWATELAERLGVRGPAPEDVAPREVVAGVPDDRRVLAECAALSCVTESLSTVALLAMRERATRADVRAVLHEVLRDEIAHARLGWAYLSTVDDARAKAWLGRELPAIVDGAVTDELLSDEPEDAAMGALEGLGCLSRATRRAVFVAALRDVIAPGFDACGVPTGALRERYARWL